MPEICANAAIYFDPRNPVDIADSIFKAIMDRELISRLVKNAIKRADRFSWENSIRATLRVIESVGIA